jgi:hypothetical protein
MCSLRLFTCPQSDTTKQVLNRPRDTLDCVLLECSKRELGNPGSQGFLLVTAGPCCCTWCDNLYQYMIKLLKVLLVTEVLPKGSVVACWAHAVLYLQPCYELPTNLWCPLTKLPHGHPAPDTCTESPAATWSTASSLHTTLKAGYNQGTGKCRQGCGVLLGGTLGPCPMQS